MTSDATKHLLRKLKAIASEQELRDLFSEIRRRTDTDLLAKEETHAPRKRPPRDAFVAAIEAQLEPIVAPASEKAEMLVDALAAQGIQTTVKVKGLAPTVRRLAALHGEEKVEAAARALMERLRDWGSTRERVT